ncbi:FtsQ-type POTRA domain-containing protein [Adlercreutzia sp. ZJ304]|uniref:cell division protein FtsQ/DivIB n=1 Tax=Adlercreutzia sp. ZJ304 TaxID=2709791 RepID=UPI001F154BB1|nr:FtsQ-type POTRA domain-containing protein [Adlercreutzia sp. ZJ304]
MSASTSARASRRVPDIRSMRTSDLRTADGVRATGGARAAGGARMTGGARTTSGARANRNAAAESRLGNYSVQGGRTVSEINRMARNQERRQRRAESMQRAARATRRPLIIIGVIVALIIAFMLAVFIASRTDLFLVEEVKFEGVEHLTSTEANALVNVPEGTTLLNVDIDSIKASLMRDSWVESVEVKREFPSTLTIVVNERDIAAIVEIPMGQAQTIQNWAISPEGIWIMAIPNQDSEIGQQISPKIYEDADSAIHITGVQVGVIPEMGKECTDPNVNNALEIITGLTTDLANQVKSVSASDVESTTLTLKSNVEIAFGTADNIRDKERVCLEIMEKNPKVVYINVRVADRPTWRSPDGN